MLSEEVIDKVVKKLTDRINEANEYILRKIGANIKKIGTLTPSKAHQLIQIMRYGGDYDKIIKKLAEVTKLNSRDIKKIFEEVARGDYNFAKNFYTYRNKKFIPFEQNKVLQEQIDALARITINEYQNLTKTMAYAILEGKKKHYTPISKAYQKILDKAVLNVTQGKESFDSAMHDSIKELAENGIRVVEYTKDGKVRHLRVDSAVRMQLKGAITDLHNELQKTIGEDIKADGYEISVHMSPAPDHEKVQGRQFSIEEFENFQNDRDAKDVTGRLFPAESEETHRDRRSIGQYNCYHYAFSIVIGVNKPQYSDEQLQSIIDTNEEGITYKGEHFTNYQATQIQRKLETEIRKAKDVQIMAKATDNENLLYESQDKINRLTREYKNFSRIANLPVKKNRLRVSGYRSVPPKYNNGETYAINKYLSPYSIGLNEKLRNNIELDTDEKQIVKNLDMALEKTTNYNGDIVRELEMNNPQDFINQLKVGEEYSTNQYLSFSTKKGYNDYANIKIYVNNSKNSKDLTKINQIGENETLYKRNSKFITEKIVNRNGVYYVYWKEK